MEIVRLCRVSAVRSIAFILILYYIILLLYYISIILIIYLFIWISIGPILRKSSNIYFLNLNDEKYDLIRKYL